MLNFLRKASSVVAVEAAASAGPDRRAGRETGIPNRDVSARPAVAPCPTCAPLRELSFALVDDNTIAAINQQFLNHTGPTDVISFNLGGGLGEIVVSAERAVIVARQLRRPPADELALYLVHGLLHLAGCDDRTPAQRRAMRAAERRCLQPLRCAISELCATHQ